MDNGSHEQRQGLDVSVQPRVGSVEGREPGGITGAQTHDMSEQEKPSADPDGRICESRESNVSSSGASEPDASQIQAGRTPSLGGEGACSPMDEVAQEDANQAIAPGEAETGKAAAPAESEGSVEGGVAWILNELEEQLQRDDKQMTAGKAILVTDKIPEGGCIQRVFPVSELLKIQQLVRYEQFIPTIIAEESKQRHVADLASGIARNKHREISGIILALIDHKIYRLNGDLKLNGAARAGVKDAHTVIYKFPSVISGMQFAVEEQCKHRKTDSMVLLSVAVMQATAAKEAAGRRKCGVALKLNDKRGSVNQVIGGALGVSASTIHKARTVLKSETHYRQVLSGEASINRAYKDLMAKKAPDLMPDSDSELQTQPAENTPQPTPEILRKLFTLLYADEYDEFIRVAQQHNLHGAIPPELLEHESLKKTA